MTDNCNSLQAGCVGVVLTLSCYDCEGEPVDISGASNLQMIFRHPQLGRVERDAIAGAEVHQMTYETVDGDFVTTGEWSWQGVVTTLAGVFRTAVTRLTVRANI